MSCGRPPAADRLPPTSSPCCALAPGDGHHLRVVLPFGTPDALAAGRGRLRPIDRLEDQLTVYRDTSEVSRLNRAAATPPVPVEDGLFDLLQLAARITAETGGAFDVTAGALIKAWGFFRGPRRVPSDAERAAALERVGMRHVVLDPETAHGALSAARAGDQPRQHRQGLRPRPGGGDPAARAGICSAALLHGGHSSVYAIGTTPDDDRGWAVGIAPPVGRRTARSARVWLRDRALGTSAATFQYLEYDGRKLGHVLDPRTGWPAAGMASASVVAPTAAEADALSTAFYVLGIGLDPRVTARPTPTSAPCSCPKGRSPSRWSSGPRPPTELPKARRVATRRLDIERLMNTLTRLFPVLVRLASAGISSSRAWKRSSRSAPARPWTASRSAAPATCNSRPGRWRRSSCGRPAATPTTTPWSA